ncbi:hypothetical protein WHR41_02260 [Cladosporium halotolerans]|uniref:Oxidoreductase-like domain-containing protein n=1 Tax=Cladosporium halotolerans TaxID=1052096 RepID=A0AB34KW53_9PEZI
MHQRMRSQCTSLAISTLKRVQCRPARVNAHRSAFGIRHKSADAQRIDEYAEDSLNAPLNPVQAGTNSVPPPATPPPIERPRTGPEEQALKAQALFGSRTADPDAREAELKKASTNIAGVLVPPRPDEPDNCCMSGCVNCVWDRYRDELEEWAAASKEARQKMQEQRIKGQATGMMSKEGGMPTHAATSMDDDGGGSETNWDVMEGADEGEKDLFEGVPVGIREFMKIEKRLKEQHRKEQAADQ